jgi:iron(III) transport system permease protein
MTGTLQRGTPPGLGRTAVVRARPRGAQRRIVVVVGALIAAALLAPLVLIALDARSAGWTEVHSVLFRARSLMLLRHTVVLSLLVLLAAATIGVAAAWCTERCALPGRRIWTVLLVLPVAMPDFVVGYAWHSFAPQLNSLFAATLVMTLGTYPLVYLPVAAALRRADPVMEDTAHSLGAGRISTFIRISLPSVATAVLGGGVLVVLTVISEYGAFEILRYSTFTTEIFTEFGFEPQAAGALAIPLVLLGLIALSAEGFLGRRRGLPGVSARRPTSPPRWPRWPGTAVIMTVALLALVGLGVGVPIGTLVYWMAQSQHTTLPAAATLGQATWTTLRYSAWGALLAVTAAVPVAMMSFRRRTRTRAVLERATFVTQAVPGVVIALSLVFFATRYAFSLYQTGLLLVIAYAIIHFPLALVCVKTSTTQAPARLIDIGNSLGRRPVFVFIRVTLPLLAPGLLAGFCLVFLTAVTELTATLVLAPIGVHTLATQFWAFQSEVAYGAAAPYALVIVILAVIPGALVGLWFDREQRKPASAST